MEDRQWFVLYVLVCLEVGILLILVPWTSIWDRNYFLQAYPTLTSLMLEPAFRGAVSGLGVANIYLGLNEILWRHRRPSADSVELFAGGLGLPTDDGERKGRSGSSSEDSIAQSSTLLTHEESP